MADRALYTRNQIGYGMAARRIVLSTRSAPILTTDLSLNRTIGLLIPPRGFVVTGHSLTITDIDTNASPTHAFTIGITGTANLLATTATTGQAGGTLTTLAATGLYYKFVDDNTEVFLTSTTAAATAAAGTLTYILEGFME